MDIDEISSKLAASRTPFLEISLVDHIWLHILSWMTELHRGFGIRFTLTPLLHTRLDSDCCEILNFNVLHHCSPFPSGKRYFSSLLNWAKDIDGTTLDKNLALPLFQIPLQVRKYSYKWKMWSVKTNNVFIRLMFFLFLLQKSKPILWQNHNPYLISSKQIMSSWDWCSSYFCFKNQYAYCGKFITLTWSVRNK